MSVTTSVTSVETAVVNFDEYQDRAATTAKYLEAGEHNRVVYPLLGLAGEVGEAIAAFLDAVWGRLSLNEMNPLEQRVWLYLNGVATQAGHCEALKKQLRKGTGELLADVTAEHREQLRQRVEAAYPDHTNDAHDVLIDESGDVLWYLSQLHGDLGGTIRDAAWSNVSKLSARAANGQIVERATTASPPPSS